MSVYFKRSNVRVAQVGSRDHVHSLSSCPMPSHVPAFLSSTEMCLASKRICIAMISFAFSIHMDFCPESALRTEIVLS